MNLKTPGVYIEEVQLFPPSVAGVATAIPAFIGHTERTMDSKGDSLINRPVRLSSFVEFTNLFGGPWNPSGYIVQIDQINNYGIIKTSPADGTQYYFFDAIRHYFDNGGGPCYIVATGDYTEDIEYGDDTRGLRGGLKALEKVDEVTILASPDSVALNFNEAGNLHKSMIDQCNRLLDRFAILDMVDGHHPAGIDPATNPVLQFRNEVGTDNLKYAATYYPWLRSSYLKNIRFTQLSFVDNNNPPQPVPEDDIDTITGVNALDSLVTTLRTRLDQEHRVFSKIVTIELERENYQPLSSHFEELRSVVLAAMNAATARPAFSSILSFVREIALAFRELETEAIDNSPGLNIILEKLSEDEELLAQIVNLISFEKNTQVMNSIALGRDLNNVENDYNLLNEEEWIGGVSVGSIAADTTDYSSGSIALTAQAAANSPILQTAFEVIAQAFTTVIEEILFLTDQADKNLFAQHPFFRATFDRIRKDISYQPPSGAIAGIYAAVDRSRGVWKAPANMSLRSVIAPAVKLTDQDQELLNVHGTGKSINAIRAFTGKGILVWGARTLAGNDNEWRYINVRRFFTYVEESAKKASEPFVFEPNDANTWIRVQAMIENFLTLQWRQGALTGSTPAQAFFVKVGLGETMTPQDILDGRMIVEIGMAAVRPAEFIVIRFSHKMQE